MKKGAALLFLIAPAVVSGASLAQGANGPTAPLRGCVPMEGAARSECPDKPSRAAAPSPKLALAGDGWIISETTSPVDYSPIATATTSSLNVVGGSPMRLSIRCRGGRTELIVAGPAITGRGDDYFISYRVNGGQSVQLAGVVPALLQSLPGQGEFVVRLFALSGNALEGTFSLDGLERLRTKIGATCKWPHAIANPNER
jgi:hypothetical protein